MTQVLEFPWNGVALDGGLPNVSSPTSTSNPFYFLHARNVQRVRVYLNPRVVMPVGTSVIPGGVQTTLTAIANAARATVGATTLTSQIEWAMQGATEPTSATESQRPTVEWLETFWEQVDNLLGSHAATWGYAVLTQPRALDLWRANDDPDPAVATWADVSWSPTEVPWTNTAPWLEAITSEVVTHLRTSGCTVNIVLPTVYNPGSANPVKDSHPNGPWVNDAEVWYEATVTPMGTDGYSATKSYAAYNTDAYTLDASYRDIWYESVYASQLSGATPILDPLDLNPPNQLELPPEDPSGAVAFPPTAVTATALNGGGLISWTQPDYFGDGSFEHYRVDVFDSMSPTDVLVTFVTDLLSVNAGPLTNGTEYLAAIYTVTTEGRSTPASAQFTPSLSAPNPVGGWHQNPDDFSPGYFIQPEPILEAFPQERNFVPANWLKHPDEVEEGF